jgi:arylsulfatase A-like enzyme
VLAEVLSEAGYTTRGFSANANISDAFHFTRGFDEFDHSWRGQRRDEKVLDWGSFISETRDRGAMRYLDAIKECIASDVDTLKSLSLGIKMKARDLGIEAVAGKDDGASKALDLVEQTDFSGDEFLFVNLMEAHAPYNAPKSYQTVSLDEHPSFDDTIFDGPNEEKETIEQAYDDCVRYLSDVYQEIFATLSDEFDYVVTVSDHGEMFGKDGIWDHNYGIYPELTHVPLSIYSGTDTTEVCEETVSLVDLYQTILDMAGCDSPVDTGRSLMGEISSQQYLVERHGLRTSRVEDLENAGHDQEFIDELDEAFYGVVFEDGSYGWESRGGVQKTGSVDSTDISNRIDELRAELEDPDEPVEVDGEIPDDVNNRLEELGYL